MVQKIALFNHKGGVSKTTTTFNLGWMLASKGKRVILVDTDPQCNLTGMALKTEESEEDEIRKEFSKLSFQTPDNIADAIRYISNKKLWDEIAIKISGNVK